MFREKQTKCHFTHSTVPDPELARLLGAQGDQVVVVGAPGEEGNGEAVPAKGVLDRQVKGVLRENVKGINKNPIQHTFIIKTYRIHLPDDDGAVLGAGGQSGAVIGELTVPDLVAVLLQNLRRLTG